MICGKCGKEIPDNAKFCRFCGGKTDTVRVKNKYCVRCGKPLPEGAKFCPECETAVSPDASGKNVSSQGVTIHTDGPVQSITVSDEIPPRNESAAGQTKANGNNADSVKKAAKYAASVILKSIEADASSVPGEVSYSISKENDKALNNAIGRVIRTIYGK